MGHAWLEGEGDSMNAGVHQQPHLCKHEDVEKVEPVIFISLFSSICLLFLPLLFFHYSAHPFVLFSFVFADLNIMLACILAFKVKIYITPFPIHFLPITHLSILLSTHLFSISLLSLSSLPSLLFSLSLCFPRLSPTTVPAQPSCALLCGCRC